MEAQLTGLVRSDDDLVTAIANGALRGADAIVAWDAQLTDAAARAIANAPESSSITYVDLSWNHIGGAGAVMLESLARLVRLRLYHNDVGADGAAQLADAGDRLELLNLCGNQLGDAGLVALAHGRLVKLHELALGWNDLGGEAARAIVDGPWRSLARLNVRANRLDADAVAALLSGALPALTWLGVDENPLGGAGLAAILASPGFAKLEWLNLGGTELDDDALARFADVGRCALRELRIHDNDLSNAAIDRLAAALPDCEVRP